MPERRINGAVIVFLIFSTLYLVAAGLGMAGVHLAEGAVLNSLLQGSLTLACMLVLAARLKSAEKLVAGLGLAIWLVPIVTAGLPPLRLPSPGGNGTSSKAVVIQRLAQQWAMPLELRPLWARLATQSAYNLEKYPEAPEIRDAFERRSQEIIACLRAHPSEFRSIREALHRKGLAANPRTQPQESFEKFYLEALRDPVPPQFRVTITQAVGSELESQGVSVKASPLPEADQTKAVSFAKAWLDSHPSFVEKLIAGGPSYTGDKIDPTAQTQPPEDLYESFKREKAMANPGLWIALAGAWLAWSGRAALQRPWEAGNFLPWASQGLRALVRPGGMPRILLGMAIMGTSMALVLLMFGLDTTSVLRKLFAGLMMLGAILIYSGLTVSDES